MLTRVNRIIVVLTLGFLFLTLLESDVQAQSRNRLSIRNRREVAQSEEKTEVEHLPALANATSDRQTRQQVGSEILSIPGLTQDDLYRIQTVLNTVSVFRRLPIYQIEVDKSMVMFMVNNPDSVVSIWDRLGISQISVKRRDNNLYSVSDTAGTSGIMKKIWSGNNGVLYYLEGSYKGPMISKRIKGRALILARFEAKIGESGAENVVCYVDTYLSLEQEFFDAGVKLLFPMFGRVADNNLEQTLLFVRWYSDGCKNTPVSLVAFAMDLDDIPYQTRQELAKQTFLTAKRNGNAEIVLNDAKLSRSKSQLHQDISEHQSSAQALVQAQPYQVNYPPVKEDSYTPMEPEPIQLDPIEEQHQLMNSEAIVVDSVLNDVLESDTRKTDDTELLAEKSILQDVREAEVPEVDTSSAPVLEDTVPVLEDVESSNTDAIEGTVEDTVEESVLIDTKSSNKQESDKQESDKTPDEVELELELEVALPEEVIQEVTPEENSDKQTKDTQSDKKSDTESEPAPLPDTLPDALPIDDEQY